MNNNTSIQHPYIGDIDIDWEEEKKDTERNELGEI